jgi:very-short-patch-repair endonuclease
VEGIVDAHGRQKRRRPAGAASETCDDPPEGILWQILRARPGDLKFRRQHPIGPYVVDFYCAAARLAIEVDGASHDMGDRPAHDARRDAWLRRQGLRVIRFNAGDVMKDPESAVTQILLVARG